MKLTTIDLLKNEDDSPTLTVLKRDRHDALETSVTEVKYPFIVASILDPNTWNYLPAISALLFTTIHVPCLAESVELPVTASSDFPGKHAKCDTSKHASFCHQYLLHHAQKNQYLMTSSLRLLTTTQMLCIGRPKTRPGF